MSHRVAYEPGRWSSGAEGLWTGGVHLAESFDTVGVFARDPRDVVSAVDSMFGIEVSEPSMPLRFGCVTGGFIADSDPGVLDAARLWRTRFEGLGCVIEIFEPREWEPAAEIFSLVQAHEAARLHEGHYDAFEPAIAQRLKMGAEITAEQVTNLRERMREFSERVIALFDRFDFLMLPCAPVLRLVVGEDQRGARPRILKYTAPFSLAGLPVLALPGELAGGALGSGVQIAARPGHDGRLLWLAHDVGHSLAGL
jgi:Asp-tRNA(Asn)/Glu-tRNA(Gln) amidotransferase A subunit family amidase